MGTYADSVGELRHEVHPPGTLERVQITTVTAGQDSYCMGMTTDGLPTVYVRGPGESLSG